LHLESLFKLKFYFKIRFSINGKTAAEKIYKKQTEKHIKSNGKKILNLDYASL